MCELCTHGKGACTCRINCGSPDCRCPAFLTADFMERWNAVRADWDAIAGGLGHRPA